MKDLQAKITKLVGEDKLLHFFAGGWIACLASEWYISLLIGLFAGLSKEIFDKYIKKSTFDYWDWLATFMGSLVTAVFGYLK